MSIIVTPFPWYTDPPWDLIARQWLLEYVLTYRTNPAGLRALMGGPTEFEMVPMPKELLQGLSKGAAQTSTPTSATEYVARRESAKHLGDVEKLVRTLFEAIGAGRTEEVAASVSPGYFDLNRRNQEHLMSDVKRLFDVMKYRKAVPLSIDNVSLAGAHLFAHVKVGWEADVATGQGTERKHGVSTVELLLERSGDGTWKIASIRTV